MTNPEIDIGTAWYVAVAGGDRKPLGGHMETIRYQRRRIDGRMQFPAEYFLKRAGYEVFAPIEQFKVWIRHRKVIKDRPQLGRYIFVRGSCPWSIPLVEGVSYLVLDADGRPAQIQPHEVDEYRTHPSEKPKPLTFRRGQIVRVSAGTLQGMEWPVKRCKPHRGEVGLDTDHGLVWLPVGHVERV